MAGARSGHRLKPPNRMYASLVGGTWQIEGFFCVRVCTQKIHWQNVLGDWTLDSQASLGLCRREFLTYATDILAYFLIS